MKPILITVLTFLIGITGRATGYVSINCHSQNARILLVHFGTKDSVGVRRLIYGPGFPHPPSAKPILSGSNLYIQDDGVLFLLRYLFEESEPSYPTPMFEVIEEKYPHRFIESGHCEKL